jgi:hypothetical protein
MLSRLTAGIMVNTTVSPCIRVGDFHPSEIDKIVPGARLVDASVEITSDRVVVDMNKRFPWFDTWVQDWENRRRGGLTTRPGEFLFTPYRLVGDS